MHSTATRFTLNEIVWFCLKYGRKAFPDHDTEQIMSTIIKADAANKLHIVADDQGISGVCVCTSTENSLYIHHIVCVRTGFKTFVQAASKLFPSRELCGERKEKFKFYWTT